MQNISCSSRANAALIAFPSNPMLISSSTALPIELKFETQTHNNLIYYDENLYNDTIIFLKTLLNYAIYQRITYTVNTEDLYTLFLILKQNFTENLLLQQGCHSKSTRSELTNPIFDLAQSFMASWMPKSLRKIFEKNGATTILQFNKI